MLMLCSSIPLFAAEGGQVLGGDDQLFGMQRSVVTVLGIGIALVLLAVLFLIRRFIGTVMNMVFLLLGVVLVIVALFGHQIGIYDAIDDVIKAGRHGAGP